MINTVFFPWHCQAYIMVCIFQTKINHFRSVCTLMLPEHCNDVTDHKSRSGLKYMYKYIPIKLEGDPLTLSIVQGTQWNASNLIGLG